MQYRMMHNRAIGVSILALAAVIFISWLVISKNSIRSEFKKEATGDLPPPPAPPSGRGKAEANPIGPAISKDEEIRLEPVSEEPDEDEAAMDSLLNQEMDYWAAPPPTAHTPYPSAPKDPDELDRT